MAKITLNNDKTTFVMWYNEIAPQTTEKSVDYLYFSTPGNHGITFTGGPFKYDSQGTPLSGNVDNIEIRFANSNNVTPDILIEDVDVGITAYNGLFGAGSTVDKSLLFWAVTLQGDDTIDLGKSAPMAARVVHFAGDGYTALSDTAGNDTIRGDIGSGVVAGDYFDLLANKTLLSGDDDIRLTASYGGHATGDVAFAAANSKLFGGNDVIRLGSSGGSAFGDVNMAEGVVVGGHDSIWGGDGKDYIVGDVSYGYNATIRGGNDVIHGGGGHDTIYGDVASVVNGVAYGGNDKLYGDAGNDTINGNSGNDSLDGGSNHDQLVGAGGNDWLRGGTGRDTMSGGLDVDTADYADRTHKVEVVLDANGDAIVKVDGIAEDTLLDIENVNGGSAGDKIAGSGAGGDNRFSGRGGNDTLSGGAGEDALIGGAGRDKLTGGTDADTFVFNAALGNTNVDVITDFVHGTDGIALDDAIFKVLGSSVTSSEFVALAQGHAAIKAAQHIIYDKSNGTLWYDADGVGGKAAVQFAQLGTAASHPVNLTWDDFAIV